MHKTSRYLIISEENKSKKILHSTKEKLLEAIKQSTRLEYDNDFFYFEKIKFKYILKLVSTDREKGVKQFFVLVVFLADDKNIEQFELLDSELNSFIDTYNDLKMHILEDALSQYYSKEAYELIHVIENKTRALISEVMFLKSKNLSWEKLLTSSLSIRDNNKSKESSKPLDGKYFSDLTKMLFTLYEEKNPDEDSAQDIFVKNLSYADSLLSKEKVALESDELENLRKTFEAIQVSAPRSVWDRYLSGSIKHSEQLANSLSTILKQLEKPRNSIAHNKVFRKSDYDSLKNDVEKIVKQINQALDSFEDTNISMYTHEEESEMLEILDVQVSNVEYIEVDEDDLTIIVPAQEDGFKEVFLRNKEWYDIRISKEKRNKIKYIAGYEVAPKSGVKYWAKVKEIVPSDNYIGYWRVVFDGEIQEYSDYKGLGTAFAPQNSRYVSKKELDEADTLDKVF